MRIELFNGDNDNAYVAVHDRDEAWRVPVADGLAGQFRTAAKQLVDGFVTVPMLDMYFGTVVDANSEWVLAATYYPGNDTIVTTGKATGAALRYLGSLS